MSALKNKVVVITGASSGIGLEAAKQFAEQGAKLALLARSADKLSEVGQLVREIGVKVISVPTDVTNEASVLAAFQKIEDELGAVDLLVNNAGVGFATDLASCSLEDFRTIFETNVTGVFLCTRAVLPAMKTGAGGHIINVSSIVGKVSNPNAPLYCASKHALNGYNNGLMQQVTPSNVKVSLVSPSGVDTAYWDGRQVDRSKLLKPEEVAAAILFVASQPAGVLIKDVDLIAFRP